MKKKIIQFIKDDWKKTRGWVVYFGFILILTLNSVYTGIKENNIVWFVVAMWQAMYGLMMMLNQKTINLQSSLIRNYSNLVDNQNETIETLLKERPRSSPYFKIEK